MNYVSPPIEQYLKFKNHCSLMVTLDKTTSQRAWLRLEKGVTICGKRMRSTHLPHVYVEWSGHQQAQGTTKRYMAPLEERELESMRLEWSYLRGRDDYMLRRNFWDTTVEGCWMKGTLMELRQSQAAGKEGPGGIASYFGVGHLGVRSGGVIYVARCGMVVVEPLSLVVQRSATSVKCRKRTPPRWRIGRRWVCGYPEIRPCNGPEPLPGHHRTNFPGTRGAAELDPGEEASKARPEEDQGGTLTQEALETLAANISRHWLGGYAGLESLPGIIGTAMMGVSAAELVISTAVRMSVLYAWKGPGLWMIAAVWGTAFQMITMPGRWALEWGRVQGEAISQTLEAKIGGANLPIDGGGTGSRN